MNNLLNLSINNTATGGIKVYDEIIRRYISNNIDCQSPLFLSLKITDSCNANCLYCIVDAKNRVNNYADLDRAKPLLLRRLSEFRKFAKPIVFDLCGGEPLLFPKRCMEYFKVFENDDVIFSILSNLSIKFTQEHEELFEFLESKPLSFIQTSIDSLSYDTHNKLRRGSNLNVTLKNIQYLKSKNIKVKVNLTISEYNCQDVFKVIDWICENDIESLHINHVLPYGRASSIVNENALSKIVKALLEVSKYKNFLKIKEHTITWPSEIHVLSLIGSKMSDIQSAYPAVDNERIYPRSNFVFSMSHDSELCNSGWRSENMFDLNKWTITEIYNTFKKESNPNRTFLCEGCKLMGYCDFDSFYTKKCFLLDLKTKIETIMSKEISLSKNEESRLNLCAYLNERIDSVLEVVVSYTKNCNGNCVFCQVNGNNNDEEQYFSAEELIWALDESNYIVQFTGGEPLLRQKELGELIPKLKNSGHIVSILTNLVLISDEFIEILKKYFTYNDYLQVSVYANNPVLHYEITGRNDWEELNKKIIKVIHSGIPLRANITLTSESMDYLKETVEHYKGLGINQISVNGLLKKGRACELVDEFYILKYIDCIYEYITNNDMDNISLSVPIEAIKTLSNINTQLNIKCEKADHIVRSRNNKIKIDHSGCIISYLTHEKIDNISNKKIIDIKLEDIKRDLSKSECSKCTEFNRCNGYVEFIDIEKQKKESYSYCDLQ